MDHSLARRFIAGAMFVVLPGSFAAAQTAPPSRFPLDPLDFSLTPKYLATEGSPASAPAEAVSGAQNGQNEANNPLTPKITINLHDYYIPSFHGIDGDGNQFLLRGLVPHAIGGPPQLFRFTLPVVTAPTGDDTSFTGLGDLTLMDLFVIPGKPVEFGAGPLLVVPMGPKETSSQKWQLGAAGIAIAPRKWGLLGALATYQQSFAGDGDRDDVSLFTFQPLALYNLPRGFYLRSTAIWNYDANAGTYYIPAGFGAGKVFQFGKVTVNAFVEPQYTLFHGGAGTPEWQIFFGVNFQFALK